MRKKILYMACLLMSFTGVTEAQEVSYMLGVPYWTGLKNDYSIVREVDSNNHMVFTYYEGRMTFSLINENPLDVKNFDFYGSYISTFISDFEIIGNMVIYCGSRMGRGMVGMFDYTSTSTMFNEYYPCGGFPVRDFSRLDVYNVDGEIHAVMVGSTYDEEGCVAELYFAPGYVVYVEFGSLLENEVFDDIAVMEKHVVTTSRVPTNSTGYYRLFNKPASAGSDIFSSSLPVNYNIAYAFDFMVVDTIMIEFCEAEVFTVATRSSEGNGTDVASYGPSGMIASVHISPYGYDTLLEPRDIKYDMNTRELHLLQRATTGTNTGALVSHVDATMAMGTGIVPGHFYDSNNLYSIDRLNYQPGRVIATGKPLISPYPPVTWVYFHDANSWNACTEYINAVLTPIKEMDVDDINTGLIPTSDCIDIEMFEIYDEEYYIEKVCE